MAVNEAEILRQLESSGLGTGKFSDSQAASIYDKLILDFGNDLMESFRDEIQRNTKSNNGALKSSVNVLPSSNGMEIFADYYYKFIDDGVSGVGQFQGAMKSIRPVVSNGLYQFKNLSVPSTMAQSIREWSGASIEQSYAIAVNIKRYGIKPKNITEQVITDEVLERMAEDIATVSGLMIEVSFDKAFE